MAWLDCIDNSYFEDSYCYTNGNFTYNYVCKKELYIIDT